MQKAICHTSGLHGNGQVTVAALTQYLLECTATGKKPVDQIIALRKGLSDSLSDMMKANEAIFGFSRTRTRVRKLNHNYKKWKPRLRISRAQYIRQLKQQL